MYVEPHVIGLEVGVPRRTFGLGTIMVVDDDPDMREMIGTFVASDGFTPVVARNGREALDLLLNGCRPTMILLDLMMPVMDGWSFLKAQYGEPDLATIPVIVVSAIGEPTAPWPTTVAAVIPKPCNFDLLLDSIRSVSLLNPLQHMS